MNELYLIYEMTYRSYAYNRTEAPQITPNSWKKVYGQEVDDMEKRYQAEKQKEAA